MGTLKTTQSKDLKFIYLYKKNKIKTTPLL